MFDNVLGHRKEKVLLSNMISTGSLSHSYLFCGKEGIGKAIIAKEFAKKILNTENLEICPDYKYTSKKEDKKDILVDQIRENIIENMYILPAVSDKKVYIIDDAHLLNIASQNALLKTLEEPPKHMIIILVASSKATFLPTIISRLNIIEFSGLEDNEVKEYVLSRHQISLSEKMISYADGSLKTAEEILNPEVNEQFVALEQLFEYMINKKNVKALLKKGEIDFSKSHMLDYLEYILYINNNYSSIQFVENTKIRLKNNGNYDIVIDSMILKIIDAI